MYSIRRRLMLVLAAGFAALILGAAIYSEGRLRGHVTRAFDGALLARARALVSLTDEEHGEFEFDYKPDLMPEFERSEAPDYFQFWLDDGTVHLRSRRLEERDLPCRMSLSTEPLLRDVILPDGRAGRAAELAFVPREAEAPIPPSSTIANTAKIAPAPGERGLILVVARGREGLDRLLAQIRFALLGVGGLTVGLAVLLVWRALAVGLRPLEKIASQVQALDAETLDSRVVLETTPRELAPVVQQLNALLERLSASFERERCFTGNVAHELRTPIAELRSLAEVGTAWPDDPEAMARFFGDVLDIGVQMERLIVDLLLLARCHAGVEGIESSPTHVRPIIDGICSRLAGAAGARGLSFRVDVAKDLVVNSDPGKLSILFGNLLCNAVHHALAGTVVRCVATAGDTGLAIEVLNAAERLDPDDLGRLAEPFWRKDEARSAPDHAGLGLSVVTAVAKLLHLDVEFRQDPDGTFHVILSQARFVG